MVGLNEVEDNTQIERCEMNGFMRLGDVKQGWYFEFEGRTWKRGRRELGSTQIRCERVNQEGWLKDDVHFNASVIVTNVRRFK